MDRAKIYNTGFSLVELSIVLVILGLLVGGVLSGQSLIRASELRSIYTEASNYIAAHRTFQDKYFAIPGDMANATSFWGVAGGNGTGADWACHTISSTDARTCNGNGDGLIYNGSGYENARYWQHLANAALINGSFTGSFVTNPVIVPGVNFPRARIDSRAVWIPYDEVGSPTFFSLYQADYTSSTLKPEEAWGLDTKVDDGLPLSGRMRAWNTVADTCFITATSQYALSATAKACGLTFLVYAK